MELLRADNEALRRRVAKFEEKYKNIDIDLVHQRSQLVATQVEALTRDKQDLTAAITSLVRDASQLTAIYLKIRRARELDWDLPLETAPQVDGKSWKKLIELERKAFKMIEQIMTLVDKLPCPP